MAILSRRAIQTLLDESRGVLNAAQLEQFVHRLNMTNDESLSTEWELIVLSALSNIGTVISEPELPGATRPDLSFTDDTGLSFAAEISMITDDNLHRRNPVGPMNDELLRRANEKFRGHHGSFSVWVATGNEGQLILPAPHQFRKYIFDDAFDGFLTEIGAAPGEAHVHSVENDQANVRFVYEPGRSFGSVHHRAYTSVSNPKENSIYNRLQKKRRQLKKSGYETGAIGVVLCDGGCSAMDPNSLGPGFDRITREFLDEHNDIDFVVGLCVLQESGVSFNDRPPFRLDLRVFERFDRGIASMINKVFTQALATIPPPIRSISGARSRTQEPFRINGAALSSHLSSGGDGKATLSISMRAVAAYLAGKLDREGFERVAHPDFIQYLSKALDHGAVVDAVEVVRHEYNDDNYLRLTLESRSGEQPL